MLFSFLLVLAYDVAQMFVAFHDLAFYRVLQGLWPSVLTIVWFLVWIDMIVIGSLALCVLATIVCFRS